jgi:hypothetical protein
MIVRVLYTTAVVASLGTAAAVLWMRRRWRLPVVLSEIDTEADRRQASRSNARRSWVGSRFAAHGFVGGASLNVAN